MMWAMVPRDQVVCLMFLESAEPPSRARVLGVLACMKVDLWARRGLTGDCGLGPRA